MMSRFILHTTTDSMAGDVNLFFNEPDDVQLAEIEVMIAGKASYCQQLVCGIAFWLHLDSLCIKTLLQILVWVDIEGINKP